MRCFRYEPQQEAANCEIQLEDEHSKVENDEDRYE